VNVNVEPVKVPSTVPKAMKLGPKPYTLPPTLVPDCVISHEILLEL
jgi:hypothetical protein